MVSGCHRVKPFLVCQHRTGGIFEKHEAEVDQDRGLTDTTMNAHDEAGEVATDEGTPVKLTRWQRMTPEQRLRHAETVARWKARNKERFNRARKEYVARNKVLINTQKRAWARRNKSKAYQGKLAWNAANPAKVREYSRRTRAKGRGATADYLRKWRALNPGASSRFNRKHYYKDLLASRANGRINSQKRRGQTLDSDITAATIEAILERQHCLCSYCSTDLRGSGFHLDHMTPLSRGGLHCSKNVQLTCPRCNLRKFTKTDAEFRALLAGAPGSI